MTGANEAASFDGIDRMISRHGSQPHAITDYRSWIRCSAGVYATQLLAGMRGRASISSFRRRV